MVSKPSPSTPSSKRLEVVPLTVTMVFSGLLKISLSALLVLLSPALAEGSSRTFSLHVVGTSPVYQVKPGPPVFLENVVPGASGSGRSSTPYSNDVTEIQGTISVEATDRTPKTRSDPPYTQDTATVIAQVTTKDDTTWNVVLKDVNARKPDGSPRLFGGLGTNVTVHGDSGRETRLLPKMNALLTMWGSSRVYRNGELIREHAQTHVMVNSRTRNSKTGQFYGYDTTDRPVQEVYLLLYASNNLPTPGGFLNVYWENLIHRK